eukprot:2514874-Pleurochrysis_carterae.AAC.2
MWLQGGHRVRSSQSSGKRKKRRIGREIQTVSMAASLQQRKLTQILLSFACIRPFCLLAFAPSVRL